MSAELEYKFDFRITGPLEVEEAFANRALLKGVFLKLKKVTKNGREYQIEEGESIAKGLVGMPVYFGTDPLTNKHVRDSDHLVGRVIKAVFDKAKKVIRGVIEVWNTSTFPNLIESIKKGWGFSIGGKAKDLIPTGTLNSLGRAIVKVIGMKPNHLQLLKPEVPRGQQEARVTEVETVEETYTFDPCPWGVCVLPEEHPIDESAEPETSSTLTTNTPANDVTTQPSLGTTTEVTTEPEEEKEEEVIIHRKIIKRFIRVDDPYSRIE